LNLVILAGAGGASIAVAQHQDEDTAEFFDENHHFGQGWRDALSFAGSPGTHFVLAGLWYTVGAVKQDDKTYEVGKTLIDALVINGLSTSLIKIVSNREGPNGEEQAFPSGHTSSSVTFATVMHEAYGPWVGVPLYGLSALVAMERLDDGEHWISDVVFGAALGLVVGHTVASGRPPEVFGGQLAPYVNPENGISGIAWVKTFD
jgi:membrane-associated phospholipid phosphatase